MKSIEAYSLKLCHLIFFVFCSPGVFGQVAYIDDSAPDPIVNNSEFKSYLECIKSNGGEIVSFIKTNNNIHLPILAFISQPYLRRNATRKQKKWYEEKKIAYNQKMRSIEKLQEACSINLKKTEVTEKYSFQSVLSKAKELSESCPDLDRDLSGTTIYELQTISTYKANGIKGLSYKVIVNEEGKVVLKLILDTRDNLSVQKKMPEHNSYLLIKENTFTTRQKQSNFILTEFLKTETIRPFFNSNYIECFIMNGLH